MYTRQYKTKKTSANSSETSTSNQFAPRPFVVQPQGEEITNNQTSDLQAKSDKKKQSGKSLPSVSVFSNNITQPQPPQIQMKLTIGQPGDKYEQEADRLAADVVQRINAPESEEVQRQELPEYEDKLQMKPILQRQSGAGNMAATPDVEESIQGLRGSGQPLAESIRQPMEQTFGADFSSVKIHSDSQSDQLNQSLQARAFTTGQDIFFRQSEYNPNSQGGQELLAHELTHVVQQNGHTVQRNISNETDVGAYISTNTLLLQMVRENIGHIAEGENTITLNDIRNYKDLIFQQLQELDLREPAAKSQNIEKWVGQYEQKYESLLNSIRQATQDPEQYAIPFSQAKAGGSEITDKFKSALVTLYLIRNELNNSLPEYNELKQLDEENQAMIDGEINKRDGYKNQAKQDSYKEPERAAKIQDWDEKFAYLYRKMSVTEYKKIGDGKKKFENVTADDNSRKWFSSSTSHSFKFTNDNVENYGEKVEQVIVKIKMKKQELHKILQKRFPAYKTESYKPKNKDKVLIHQELLAEGKNANTGSDEQMQQIFNNNEHFNVGFSIDTIKILDAAIIEIEAIPVG